MHNVMRMKSFTRFMAVLVIIFISFSTFAQNYVTTYAGTGTAGFMNGDTSVAQFKEPFGIAIDHEGNLYLADAGNHCIRKIGTDGQVTTYAGMPGQQGYLDGPALEAKFRQPLNICFDDEGNMYVSDFLNQRIRKISAEMEVTTIAGSGLAGYLDGPAGEAKFNYPRGICLDDTGNIYIGDSWNHRIRKISTDGIVSTWAGGGETIGVQSVGDWVDASDTAARFYTPCELSIDAENNIFVADAYNHRIRKVDATRMVTTIAGSGGFGPDGGGYLDGLPLEARFNTPTSLQVVTDGTIFVGDGSNNVLRRIYPEVEVVTYAGSGESGFLDGPDSLAQFNFPRGNVMDYTLNRLYIVDFNNHAVRILHLVSGVGIKEGSLNDNLLIYPNPSSGWINIEFTSERSGIRIKLFNASGMEVMQHQFPFGNQFRLETHQLKAGIYYFLISADDGLHTSRKVIIR